MIRLSIFAATLLFTACSHAHEGEAHDHGHAHDEQSERPALSYTHWTDQTELFMELLALVQGEESPCAAHVTRLAGFEAPASGKLTVILTGASGEERFTTDEPNPPGIFRPIAKPRQAGPHRMKVEIELAGIKATHDLGEVTVFASVEAARKGIPEEPEKSGRITFLKEQQWPIEFSTATVTKRPMRPTITASGKLVPRADADVTIAAPAAGRVASTGKGPFPRVGDHVSVQQALGILAPRLDAADIASLELAMQSGELELKHAQTERARLEALRGEGAVPERRVQEAVHMEEEAKASLEGARKRLDLFRRVQTTAARGQGAAPLLSPLTGVLAEVHVAPGAFVEAGTPLFRVIDTTSLWLEARVAEIDVPALGTLHGASFQVASLPVVELPAEALTARGAALDDRSRTLPLWFAVDNAGARFTTGMQAQVFLATGEPSPLLAVPEEALVDDGGTPVVFVQVEGEAFERRIVRPGLREHGHVAVSSGVAEGEHVAVRGAYSVKLAASSGALPAHGHSH
jgi:cobalt-zinc-cadmium efflux system membrane fusion protein